MRFRLETVFLGMLVLATSMATFGPYIGIPVAAMGLAIVGGIHMSDPRDMRHCWRQIALYWRAGQIVKALVALAAVGLLVALLIPASGTAREASPRSQCTNQMKQLGLALQNYHEVWKTFPPAYLADDHGHPMHSWRVLILPYIEHATLYSGYQFTEPWNGPNNAKLTAGAMPSLFHCRSSNSRDPLINYVAVVGPGTAWPDDNCTSFGEITDGASNTILLVEADGLDISWTEPRDLTLAELAAGYHAAGEQGLSTPHADEMGLYSRRPGIVNVLLADGTVRRLSRTVPPEAIRALVTIAGGEPIDWDALDPSEAETPVRFRWAAPFSLVVAYSLLIWRLRVERQRAKKVQTDGGEASGNGESLVSPLPLAGEGGERERAG